MNPNCQCGMTLEQPTAKTGCPECGTPICRSCGVELETTTYCRWCATSLGVSQAA
jgi:hypothetical protein